MRSIGERQGAVRHRANPAARRLWAFAVEPDRAQLSWRALGPGTVTFRGAGPDRVVDVGGGPGAIVLEELAPATDYTVEARLGPDGDVVGRVSFRTTSPPPGAELGRLATLSDIHLGRDTFGYFDTMREQPEPAIGFAERCTHAAIDAMARWGATHLIGKGDLVDHASHAEYRALADLADHARTAGLDVDVLAGNHESKPYRQLDSDEAMRRYGFTPTEGVRGLDVHGLRVALVDSSWDDHHRGRVDHAVEDLADLVRGRPALVVQHHFPAPGPVPHFWPPGVPWRESRRFLDALDRAAAGALVTAGHSHRHRRRERGSVTITEVGSPKDYPGTWAGYVIHEGGIRQVVRRVDRPDCIEWTEYTRWAALGAWGRWSPGRLQDRCFSLAWSG